MEKARILVVEDHQIISLEIKERLEELGYQVIKIVKRGEDAVSSALELLPDMILMDIKLESEMDGIEAAEIIKSKIEVPIVFLTAYADDKTIQRAKITEPYGYIVKPLDEREMHSAVEIALYKFKMEKNLKYSEERYRANVNSLEGFVYIIDRNNELKFMNSHMEDFLGKNAVGEKCYKAIYLRNNNCDNCTIEIIESGKLKNEYYHEASGKWFFTSGTPIIIDKDEKYMQNMMIDITELKRKEEIIINSLKEKEVMVKEIHHRVKNNLQIMLSLIRMQRQNCDEDDAKKFYKSCENRINTMAMIHEKLYSESDLNNIKFSAYVENLMTHLLQVYGFSENNIKIRCEFDDIKLPIDKAMPCGMIINELVSNSLKYAFPVTREGKINLTMKETDGFLELTYNDSGDGDKSPLAERKENTMGMQIIDMLSNQLSGKAKLNLNDGMNFTLKFYCKLKKPA